MDWMMTGIILNHSQLEVSSASEDINYTYRYLNESDHLEYGNMTSVSEVLNTAITVFGIFVIVATVLGNLLVIAAIFCDRRLRRVGNIFIVNLAISDILVGVLVTPLALFYQLSDYWPFGLQLCNFWVSVDVICCTASIVNLCVISYDRYNAIIRPLKYARQRTAKRAFALVVFVWLYAVVIAVPPFFGWRKQSEIDNHLICGISQELGYTFYSTIAAFYLPLLIHDFLLCQNISSDKLRSENPQRLRQDSTTSTTSSTIHRRSTVEMPSDIRTGTFLLGARNSSVCSTADVVIEISQGRRKQTIQRRMFQRQISNLTSDSSGTCSTSTTGTSETSFSDSSSDRRSIQRASNVLHNLVAANLIEIASLQESLKAVKFTQRPRDVQCASSGDELEREKEIPPVLKEEEKEETPLPDLPLKRKCKNFSLPQERRAVKTLGIVVGCFVVCWVPFFVVELLKPLCVDCYIDPIIKNTVMWLGYCNSACNPVIYTFFNKDFRCAFKKIFQCKSYASPTYL
ncbi:hypothetical protein KUTeg_005519 [Tegillarca granosa]|uniref:G-protein coupled receptors family 1 profile domain-containing protein n=1 Tax=Tegillarca granosa TaxID=220873 RepID=A0ABQ9FK08_TEGGR|nr:hypothetical protein KUTeg_005519 [Tegillarca granosa]